MSTRTSYDHGTPSWVDLMSPDIDASRNFYTSLFGWTAEDNFDPDGNHIYTQFHRAGQVVAGLGGQMPGMENAPGIWTSYVNVDDADAIVDKVEAAGGQTVVPPMDVFDFGKMGVFADPTGAMISVWQPGTHLGAQVVNESNTYSWNELMTRDLDAALPFYSAVFGWEYEQVDMGTMIYNVIKGGEEGGLGGMMAMPAEMPDRVPNHWGVYFMVDDVDAVAAKATQLGGQVTMPATDTPAGRMAGIHDPQMGSFSIIQPPAAE